MLKLVGMHVEISGYAQERFLIVPVSGEWITRYLWWMISYVPLHCISEPEMRTHFGFYFVQQPSE